VTREEFFALPILPDEPGGGAFGYAVEKQEGAPYCDDEDGRTWYGVERGGVLYRAPSG
jgi:hypothetical protein